MLLFPDMTRDQHDAQEFCFAAPCTTQEWYKLMALAKKTKPPKGAGVMETDFLKYVLIEEDDETICIIPRPATATDDDCVASGAYIRMVAEFTGMIYAVPSSCDTRVGESMASIIHRTAGVPPHQVRHVEV